MNIAIIGYSGMGLWHARVIENIDGLNLIGTYTVSENGRRLAAENELFVYSSLEELLADPAVDIVTVSTPNHLHKPICIQAMRAGKHVVCEKPVALNHWELQEMIDVAKEEQVVFTVHQNRRWDRDFRTIKYIYDQGTLGNVYRIENRLHHANGIRKGWRNQKECGGGIVLDWGSHLLDQLLQMVNRRIDSVYAEMTHITNETCEDGFTATIKFEGDLTAIVEVGTGNHIRLPRWYMLGDKGTAQIDNKELDGKIVMSSVCGNTDAGRENLLPVQESDVRGFYRNIMAAIEGKEQLLITHEEIMRVMKLMEAVIESGTNNVVITDFEER